MDRRSFLKVIGSAAAAVTTLKGRIAAEALEMAAEARTKPLPKRVLGKTGEKVSIIGYGGLAANRVEQSAVNESVSMAIERGVNYFDVAPEYGDAEERLGIALEGKRNTVFLSCKTAKRDKRGGEEELDRSLKRLRTDHFDLYQLHHIRTKEETEKALGPGGAMEAFVEAKKKGKVRFLGFSAHTTKAALLAMEKFDFDAVMFPVNFMEWFKISFGPPVVKKAKEKGMGIIAIKAMFRGLSAPGAKRQARKWRIAWYEPVADPAEVDMALRFTLSEPVTVAIPPSDMELIRLALDIAPNYRPIAEGEREKLRELSKELISHFQEEEKQFAVDREYGEVLLWASSPRVVPVT